MDVKAFSKEDEFALINEWLEFRDMKAIPITEIPDNGVIVYNGVNPIAAGFIRRCEGEYGIVDSIITNPNCDSMFRHEALDLVFSYLVDRAKEIGIKKLVGFSIDANTLTRSERFGFKKLEYTPMSLDLRKYKEMH